MEDTNHQDSDTDLDNDEFDLEEHLRKTVEFNDDTLEKLKRNDPAIISVYLQLKCDVMTMASVSSTVLIGKWMVIVYLIILISRVWF